jgi:replicative DNA helicase
MRHILERYKEWLEISNDLKKEDFIIPEHTSIYQLLLYCDFYESRGDSFELIDIVNENLYVVFEDKFNLNDIESENTFNIISSYDIDKFDTLPFNIREYCANIMNELIEFNVFSFIADM